MHCRDERFAFDRVFALGGYAGALRNACLRAKQDRGGIVARGLAELLYHRWDSDLRQMTADVVVPVPVHWTTRLARATASADALAYRLSRFLKAPYGPHILRKSRRTKPQSSLTPALRRQNLRDAFRLARGVRIQGASVLLVDDVLTTGTTADRAARVLLNSGVARVVVAVVARGIGQ